MRQLIVTMFGAAAVGVACASGALAADMPLKAPAAVHNAPYNWTGLYVGGHIGYGWMNSTDQVTAVSDPARFVSGGFIATSLPVDPKGFVGGGQIGFNWQAPGSRWVLGIEADISGTNFNNTVALPGPNDSSRIMTAQEKLDWLGTVRGRLGWTPADRLLVFATGGLAYGHRSLSTALMRTTAACGAAQCEQGSASDTHAGWVVGGGAEWAFSGNWIARAEYLYFDLGSLSHRMTDPVFPAEVLEASARFRGSIARAALSYKF
jgi:outer membrane immunogenic protein